MQMDKLRLLPSTAWTTEYAAAHKIKEQIMFKKNPALIISLIGSRPVLKATRLVSGAIGNTKAQLQAMAAGTMKV